MTDDEIYFDFLTHRLLQEEAATAPESAGTVPTEPEAWELPDFTTDVRGGPNKTRSVAFASDQQEFARWCAEELGADSF